MKVVFGYCQLQARTLVDLWRNRIRRMPSSPLHLLDILSSIMLVSTTSYTRKIADTNACFLCLSMCPSQFLLLL